MGQYFIFITVPPPQPPSSPLLPPQRLKPNLCASDHSNIEKQNMWEQVLII